MPAIPGVAVAQPRQPTAPNQGPHILENCFAHEHAAIGRNRSKTDRRVEKKRSHHKSRTGEFARFVAQRHLGAAAQTRTSRGDKRLHRRALARVRRAQAVLFHRGGARSPRRGGPASVRSAAPCQRRGQNDYSRIRPLRLPHSLGVRPPGRLDEIGSGGKRLGCADSTIQKRRGR